MAEEVKAEKRAKQEGAKQAADETKPVAAAAAAAAPDAVVGEEPKVKKAKLKGHKHVPLGIVHVRATFNNTLVSITDMKGAVIGWSTAGRSGFKGSRKSTAFAATMAAQEASRQAMGFGLQEVEVRVQGPGSGRESAIRAIQASGIAVSCIKDVTPMAHNGCRARKARRV